MRKLIPRMFMFAVYFFLYAPIIVLIVYSFNSGSTRGSFNGFSLKWYASLLSDRAIMKSLVNTLTIALFAAGIATVVGTITSYGIHNLKKIPKNFILNVNFLPVLNPEIVTGVSLLILFVFLGFNLGYHTLLLAHVIFCIPYVIISVLPKFKQLNRSVYEAAIDLGANRFQAFMRVVLPDLMPGILSGFLISLTLSIDDFVISFFTTGAGVSNLSITIYSMARKGIKPEINALSTIIFVSVFVLILVVNLLSAEPQKEEKRRY